MNEPKNEPLVDPKATAGAIYFGSSIMRIQSDLLFHKGFGLNYPGWFAVFPLLLPILFGVLGQQSSYDDVLDRPRDGQFLNGPLPLVLLACINLLLLLSRQAEAKRAAQAGEIRHSRSNGRSVFDTTDSPKATQFILLFLEPGIWFMGGLYLMHFMTSTGVYMVLVGLGTFFSNLVDSQESKQRQRAMLDAYVENQHASAKLREVLNG